VLAGGLVGRDARRVLAVEDGLDPEAVVLDGVDERLEEVTLLGGQPLVIGGHVRGGERCHLDDLPDAAFVDGLDGVLGGVDVVAETADFRRVPRVVGLIGRPLALAPQLGDELARFAVERLAELLEAVFLSFSALHRLQFVQVHHRSPAAVRSPARPARIRSARTCPLGRRPVTPGPSRRVRGPSGTRRDTPER
jgi:hypothetical protein